MGTTGAGLGMQGGKGPLAGLLSLLIAVTLALATPAHAQGRHAAMVIDANSGEVLHADKADDLRHPASLTKMMTLYMVFEQLEAGRLRPDTRLKVSQEAASAQPTKLDLEPGEQITVIDAVKALITKSANDMAIVLAEAIGGSEANFAALMTQKARALGMSRSVFRNASGLPDSAQVTTARDMLTLALRLNDDFPKYFPLFALRSFTYNGSSYRNHNTMLNSFEGIDGIKTGYTRMSGFNLVTSLRRGDKHLVGAVFGGTTAGTRNLTMRMLLTRALLRASPRKTRKPAPVLVARAKPATRAAVTTAVATAAPAKPAPAAPVATAKAAHRPAPPAQKPTTVAAAEPAPPARPVTVAVAPAPAAAPAPEPDPAPAVEIAKVRPVMVAPRVKRNVFIIKPDADEPPAAADVPPPPSPAATAAVAALESHEVGIKAAAAVAEATEPVAAATAPQREVPTAPARVVAAHAPTSAAASAPMLRGTYPSTLQAQAENLAQRPALPPQAAPAAPPARQQVAFASVAPSRLRGPDPASVATAVPAGGFHIQIGAYASAVEADRVLKETLVKSSGILASATPMTTPIEKGNRTLYRARFAGFDAKRAADTCLELRRAAIDCFVMKAE